jgi:hypothetical protein
MKEKMASSSPKGIDGFIFGDEKGRPFLIDFLRSPDFTVDALRDICKSAGIKGYSADKRTLANIIADEVLRRPSLKEDIIAALLTPFKEWVAIKKGHLPRSLASGDAIDLLEAPGKAKWYGPVYTESDNLPWYIRPIFIPHWRVKRGMGSQENNDDNENDNREFERCLIRWLCFIRIDSDYVTIHWRGLQHDKGDDFDDDGTGKRSQIETWQYIPALFSELEEMSHRNLEEVNLHSLVLDYLWENFRYNKSDYRWSDLRLRSKSAGVKLNARSSSTVTIKMGEQEIKGLVSLARTLRKSIFIELMKMQSISVSDEEHYDDVLLQALIKDFGALSYEFEVDNNPAGRVMRYYCYFGLQKDMANDDAFPHIQIYKPLGDHITQVQGILEHLRKAREYHDQPEQGSLLQQS